MNLHATYFTIKQIINSTTLIIQTSLFPTVLNVGLGRNFEFSRSKQPFILYGKGIVISQKLF